MNRSGLVVGLAAVLGLALTALPAAAATRTSNAAAISPAAGHFRAISVPGARQTMPADVSDTGVVVGCFDRKTGVEHGFIDRHGSFSVISRRAAGTGKPLATCVLGINRAGTVVGYYVAHGVFHGFIARHGKLRPLTEPRAGRRNYEGTLALSISDSGVVVGWYLSSKQVYYGFKLSDGRYTTVSAPGAGHRTFEGTQFNGIADNGTVSGTYFGPRGTSHGFLYSAGRYRPIAVPGGTQELVACISHRSGLVVGIYSEKGHSGRIGFTSQHGKLHSLKYPGVALTEPQCGNDSGAVVGVYQRKANGPSHGFMFVPRRRAE